MKDIGIFLFFWSTLFFCSCMHVKPSNLHFVPAKQIEISPNVTLSSWGAVYLMKNDFIPSSFCITTDKQTIYLDPLLVKNDAPADFICITHTHFDHMHLPTLSVLADENTCIIGPRKVVKNLENFQTKTIMAGDSLDFGFFQCKAIPSYTTGLPSHPKSMNFVGFIITIGDVRIFHPGDSDMLDEMRELKNITVAMVPIDGGSLTMSTEDAAELVNRLHPKIAIPMHYRLHRNLAQEFAKLVDPDIQVILLEN